MPTTDVTIVGGSFAGLTCAQAAASRGVNVVVLERKARPGDGCRTTGLLVKEVADAWDFPRRFTRAIPGVRLYRPNLKFFDLVSPGYYFLATDTPAVMEWMTDEARRAGADVRMGAAYDGATLADGLVRLHSHPLQTRLLVGCDGARSRVARDFRLGLNRRFLIGVEAHFDGVRGLDESRLHVFLDSQLAPGYIAWVVPGLHHTQIGLATSQSHAPRLAPLIDKLRTLFDFSGARLISHRGGLIPCGGCVAPLKRGPVMTLGDAAGMVSPLTAGGIHPAMQLGRAAGIAISDYLLAGGVDPARSLRQHAPSFRFKQLLRTAFDLAPPNWLLSALLGSHLMRKVAQTIFFHHRGLLSLEAWRDILTAQA